MGLKYRWYENKWMGINIGNIIISENLIYLIMIFNE